jgi:hypothetical protein
MRLAGQLPIDVLDLIARAGEDESQWPSRHNPNSPVPDYRYDEHMKEHVPNVPRKV